MKELGSLAPNGQDIIAGRRTISQDHDPASHEWRREMRRGEVLGREGLGLPLGERVEGGRREGVPRGLLLI